MSETMQHIPESAYSETRTTAPVTVADVRRYAVEHSQDLAFKAEMAAGIWELANILPSFETQCDILNRQGSPELRRVRELTYFLDQQTRTAGGGRMDELEVTKLIAHEAGERFRQAPKSDSIESAEAEAEYKQYFDAINAYATGLGIEPILSLVESNIAEINYAIERESRRPNKNSADERKRRAEIKEMEAERKPFRRARAFLLEQYFSPHSIH